MEVKLDGNSVYINCGGVEWQPQKKTLCLVHGASLDHTVWMLYSRYFARHGYNVICPDLPGHGRSDGAPLKSIESKADWLNRLLAQVASDAGESVALVGHSMGSLVALHAAGTEPQRYTHLLLLGTGSPMKVGEGLLNAARDNHQAAIDMVSIFGHSLSSRLGGNPVAGINIMQSAMTLMAASAPGVMYAGLNACNEYQVGQKAASQVTAKTTLILGRHDMMTPTSTAVAIGEEMSATTIMLECGHMMMAEVPEATLQAMLTALD